MDVAGADNPAGPNVPDPGAPQWKPNPAKVVIENALSSSQSYSESEEQSEIASTQSESDNEDQRPKIKNRLPSPSIKSEEVPSSDNSSSRN